MSAWIQMISDDSAGPELKAALDRARTPAGTVDNVMRVHSLRPHTMDAHVGLYKAVLHDDNNTLPLWFLELVGTYTSMLNKCDYSYANHSANFTDLLGKPERANAMLEALKSSDLEKVFTEKEHALLRYTRKLTLEPGAMDSADVQAARDAGASDGEILEVNQVCGYFCYANRLLSGLGVSLRGDHVGYYR
ncbi:MAG: carboxymuconolactone decarboxylase family protein [Gammaproteobacteria bacterium]